MVLNQVVLHLSDVFLLVGPLTEHQRWFDLFAPGGCSEVFVQEAGLLDNVTEVDKARMGHDLIHVVHTHGEVVVLAERLDLPLRVAQDVLFVALGMLVAKLTLHDIREGVWQL